MFDVRIWGKGCSDFYRANVRIVVCCAVISGVMIPCSSVVRAEESTTVQIVETANVIVKVDSQPLDVQALDSSAVVETTDDKSRPIDTDPDVSDVVDLDTRNEDQGSQLALAGSRDMQSLDVVDTGSSVEFPQAVGDMNVDPGDQPVTDSNEFVEQGDLPEAHLNGMIQQVDQSLVTGNRSQLSVDSGREEFRAGDSAVALPVQVNETEGSLEGVADDAASEESARLPYAVVLALLALIGLVPVARRNDQHHV